MKRRKYINVRSLAGFTLIELLLALAILAAVTTTAYMTFSTVIIAWKRSMTMSENLHHGDFVLEQIVIALRSAYYPSTGLDENYGFWLEDEGDGVGSMDGISWVKIGPSLVGRGERFGEGPHRVQLFGETDDETIGIRVRAWGLLEELDDFDPEEIEPRVLSTYVRGFNVRCRDPEMDEDAEEIEWLDEWEDTNRIPLSVELTVYVEPVDEGREALEVKRIVDLPVAPLSWPAK
ncbi:MAG: prepilin-type N-terminal cleavage/methylation domain-containing protein [Candidatus Promineifilaceae bacterium]|jgi:prepilin-type N-terminal cleavage/methylation domain-containing protein